MAGENDMLWYYEDGETNVTGDGSDKKYDAEVMNSFTDALCSDMNRYRERAKALEREYVRYHNNETFVGQMAEDSKRFIYEVQGDKLHMKNLELKREFLNMCLSIENKFKEEVDSSPKARVSVQTLLKIKRDFNVIYNTVDTKGYELDCHAKEAVDILGRWGVSTLPNFRRSMEALDEFCGHGRLLDKDIKKFENFDQEACAFIERKDLAGYANNLQRNIKYTADVLNGMTVYQPNVAKHSVEILSLSVMGALKYNPWDFLEKKLSGNIATVQNKNPKSNIEPEIQILMNQYGYTKEEAELIDKTINALNKNLPVLKLKDNGDYYLTIANTYGILSELCISYNSTRWRMTTGQYNTKEAIAHLKKAGLSDQEILDLRVLINLQHGDYRYSELRKAGIDIDKSTFKNETFTSINARAKEESDFAHTTVQIAAFAHGDDVYKNNRPELGRGFVDYVNSPLESYFTTTLTRYEISFKGDLDSGRYSEADYKSDLDAINIYQRMVKNGDFGMNTWASYYTDVDNDSRHRAVEFLENMGNGHADIGIINTRKIIEEKSVGSIYIQEGNGTDVQKAKKIFMQWLLCTYQGVDYEFPKQE
ncbi:hypothetical protein [Butyrivibrio sp. AE3003]|uniref:hypothetical protein n=1 Tax=Butyrivibrio sp. AE3003 TaxID=1496721 RepID=UPI00047A6C06|nr:hypothetical protein [Butyrivibrio sp. AE3003]